MKVKLKDGSIEHYKTVWMEGNVVKMIEQRLLPHEFKVVELKGHEATTYAIKNMVTRGAGAVGDSGGYAMAQAVDEACMLCGDNPDHFLRWIRDAAEYIKKARPTAQALFYSVDEVFKVAARYKRNPFDARAAASLRADQLAKADEDACRQLGENGLETIVERNNDPEVQKRMMRRVELGLEDGLYIMTHCNAGWLAFRDIGSATSPIYAANNAGLKINVWANETRPYNQGTRLTAWELMNEDINVTVLPDNHVRRYMSKGFVDMVIVGADRIVANGDTANKIGTSTVALCAREYNIPFYVAAPLHTFDFNLESGDKIPIEKRSSDEVLWVKGIDRDGKMTEVRIAPEGVKANYDGFDVTPNEEITAFITERGVYKPDELHKLAH